MHAAAELCSGRGRTSGKVTADRPSSASFPVIRVARSVPIIDRNIVVKCIAEGVDPGSVKVSELAYSGSR